MVISSSPFPSKVRIFSFSKKTSMPFSLSLRTVVKVSTVLRANRLIDFVIIRSILPASASATMRLKPSRFLVLVAEMPLVGINLYKLPLVLRLNVPGIIVHLRLIAGKLLLIVGGYTGIGCHPQLAGLVAQYIDGKPVFLFAGITVTRAAVTAGIWQASFLRPAGAPIHAPAGGSPGSSYGGGKGLSQVFVTVCPS